VQHAGDAYLIAFAFDPRRVGILLLGGRKADKKWYKAAVATADKIYERYLEELEQEGLTWKSSRIDLGFTTNGKNPRRWPCERVGVTLRIRR